MIDIIEQVKNQITSLSDSSYTEKVLQIIRAESNTYTMKTQLQRMCNTLQLLSYGVSKEVILQLLDNQQESVFITLIDENWD